jgi:hypothetical protein
MSERRKANGESALGRSITNSSEHLGWYELLDVCSNLCYQLASSYNTF